MKGLQHKTIADALVAELRRRILDGELAAGVQLRQSALAEEFGVSRIPLREAFLQLEAEGLVKINAHRGAIVSQLTAEEVDELFELRAAIEPMLLRRSAPNLTQADFIQLQALLDDFSHDLKSGNARRWGDLNTEFHRQLYQHANRPRSAALAMNLLQDCDRHTRLQLALTGATDRADAEHQMLLELCKAGKVEQAAALLEAHILNVAQELRAHLAKPE